MSKMDDLTVEKTNNAGIHCSNLPPMPFVFEVLETNVAF